MSNFGKFQFGFSIVNLFVEFLNILESWHTFLLFFCLVQHFFQMTQFCYCGFLQFWIFLQFGNFFSFPNPWKSQILLFGSIFSLWNLDKSMKIQISSFPVLQVSNLKESKCHMYLLYNISESQYMLAHKTLMMIT